MIKQLKIKENPLLQSAA